MKRNKEQGIHRLNRAILRLDGIEVDIKEIEDDMDKDMALFEIDEIKWLIREGLQDLLEGS